MNNTFYPADIISLLRDIEQRSLQSAANATQLDSFHGTWTAIGFRVAQENLLIPLNEAREIFIVPTQISPVPHAQPWVFGIANLRGELLPLFDLKYFLYGQATKVNKRSRIVVTNNAQLYAGLLLDEVFGLKHFQHEPKSESITSHTPTPISPYITGSISQQDLHWDIFSFNKLIADQRFLNAAA
ncbi:MAG: twitching motility protein PilI [Methylophagaceae bacterium]